MVTLSESTFIVRQLRYMYAHGTIYVRLIAQPIFLMNVNIFHAESIDQCIMFLL